MIMWYFLKIDDSQITDYHDFSHTTREKLIEKPCHKFKLLYLINTNAVLCIVS